LLISELEKDCLDWERHVVEKSKSDFVIRLGPMIFCKFEIPGLICTGFEVLRISYLARAENLGGDGGARKLKDRINEFVDDRVDSLRLHKVSLPGDDAGASRREL
jgi:hypothetical protein